MFVRRIFSSLWKFHILDKCCFCWELSAVYRWFFLSVRSHNLHNLRVFIQEGETPFYFWIVDGLKYTYTINCNNIVLYCINCITLLYKCITYCIMYCINCITILLTLHFSVFSFNEPVFYYFLFQIYLSLSNVILWLIYFLINY